MLFTAQQACALLHLPHEVGIVLAQMVDSSLQPPPP